MSPTRAKTFEYAVLVDAERTASSDRGGEPIPAGEAWTPEHLLLAGLARCVLTSLGYHARRAGVSVRGGAGARGSVTRRESDGRFAFTEIEVTPDVELEGELSPDALTAMLGKAERDCFVGASLAVAPRYAWTVNGERL